jgi:hypothetical protein
MISSVTGPREVSARARKSTKMRSAYRMPAAFLGVHTSLKRGGHTLLPSSKARPDTSFHVGSHRNPPLPPPPPRALSLPKTMPWGVR